MPTATKRKRPAQKKRKKRLVPPRKIDVEFAEMIAGVAMDLARAEGFEDIVQNKDYGFDLFYQSVIDAAWWIEQLWHEEAIKFPREEIRQIDPYSTTEATAVNIIKWIQEHGYPPLGEDIKKVVQYVPF